MTVISTIFTEPKIESATLEWVKGLDIGPRTEGAERADYIEVLLERRQRDASARLNLDLERLEILSYYPSQRSD